MKFVNVFKRKLNDIFIFKVIGFVVIFAFTFLEFYQLISKNPFSFVPKPYTVVIVIELLQFVTAFVMAFMILLPLHTKVKIFKSHVDKIPNTLLKAQMYLSLCDIFLSLIAKIIIKQTPFRFSLISLFFALFFVTLYLSEKYKANNKIPFVFGSFYLGLMLDNNIFPGDVSIYSFGGLAIVVVYLIFVILFSSLNSAFVYEVGEDNENTGDNNDEDDEDDECGLLNRILNLFNIEIEDEEED